MTLTSKEMSLQSLRKGIKINKYTTRVVSEKRVSGVARVYTQFDA